jgi:diguanylate cyclase (GGDEF)-like protein
MLEAVRSGGDAMAKEVNNSVLQQVLASMPVGALVLDEHDRIGWVNGQLAAYLGMTTDDLLGLHKTEDLPQHLQQLFFRPSLIIVPAGERGDERWLTCHYADAGAARVNYYIDVTEMTRIRKGEQGVSGTIQNLTVTDALTGLPNQQALLFALDPMVSRSRRYASPLSVVMVRIDGLDDLRAGHDEGATGKVILALSRLLRDQMRWADMIGRYEQNLFLCILQETGLEDASRLVAKIQSKVKSLQSDNSPDGIPDSVDVCIGIAEWRKGDDRKALISRALDACGLSA